MNDLSNIIINGMNNPDCSFWVGTVIGQFVTVKLVLVLFGVAIIYKVADKLALDPLINWTKKKFYGKKK